jgi:DNA-binding response OmpR family regulator
MGKKVLIVSGNRDLHPMLSSAVDEDWEISTVSTVRQARRFVSEDGGDPLPDLILLEKDLSDGDGLSLLKNFRPETQEFPPTILLLSQPPDESTQAEIEKYSFLDVLVRPLNPSDIERALGPLLWVADTNLLTIVEFLGWALRKDLVGRYRLESPGMTLEIEVKERKLLLLRGALFMERWRAILTRLGMDLPPLGPDPEADFSLVEAAVGQGPEVLQAKIQAVLSLLSAFPSSGAVTVRRIEAGTTPTELPIPLYSVLIELVEHCTDEHLSPLRDEHLMVMPKPGASLKDLPLVPFHGYLFSLCQKPMPVRDILRSGVLSEAHMVRGVFLLLLAGLLETVPQAPEPFSLAALSGVISEDGHKIRVQKEGIRNFAESLRTTGKSPYDILGVPPGSAYSVVVSTYDSLTHQLGPQVLLPRVIKDMDPDVRWINAKLSEAFLLIQAQWIQDSQQRIQAGIKEVEERSQHRAGADKTEMQQVSQKQQEEAERLYRKAMEFMEEEEYHQASQYIKLALFYNPLDAHYHFLQGRLLALMQSPKAKYQAEKSFLRAIELDAFTVEYRLDLARLYLTLDLLTRCRATLDKIQALDPKNADLVELRKMLKQRDK